MNVMASFAQSLEKPQRYRLFLLHHLGNGINNKSKDKT